MLSETKRQVINL